VALLVNGPPSILRRKLHTSEKTKNPKVIRRIFSLFCVKL
jgi:hypothetical protein